MVRRRTAERLASTASIAMRAAPGATRPRSSGKASRATGARSPTSICFATCRRSPTSSSRSGVKKGDRVAIYLPLIPELAIAMLACARIGAVHSVVFGGFSAESLRDRINDAQARLLITADGGYRRGQIVPLKQMADEALAGAPSIENVIVVQRGAGPMPVHIHEGPRSLVSPSDAGRAARLRSRADGCRGHALHPLHLGHDGEAEGDRPHDGRISGRHVRHDEARVRSEGRGRLLVHG